MIASMRAGQACLIAKRDAAELEIVQHATAPERCCGPAGRRQMPASSMSRGARFVMSRPSSVIVPARTGSRPKIVLNTVDLPAPFGPMTVVIAPRRTPRGRAVENRHLAVAGDDAIDDREQVGRFMSPAQCPR